MDPVVYTVKVAICDGNTGCDVLNDAVANHDTLSYEHTYELGVTYELGDTDDNGKSDDHSFRGCDTK